ncbi:hypothetical protein DFH08DRAFT_975153 [Mycena albidolilacea]|uniref:Uncharacterized protein n=1 Tax=Mycena albidolilacea TaxID=1033008 RepID=A0AAD6Z5I5_9AGAR|nr:hypothetical protein DFH08DRAFT_975153 [Mycena albidolilacea]
MRVSPEQYAALKNASEHFLAEEDFNYPHTAELMKTIFGSDCASPEALAWAKYWTDLGDADEKIQVGQKAKLPKLPPMCTQTGSSNAAMEDRDIEMPDSQPMLSNASLGSDRVDERARRKANGNIHGKEKKDIGRGFNGLMASVFIERESVNGAGIMKPIYYCIGCDTSCRNNTRKRNTPHMLACKALQRDFLRTYKEFKDLNQYWRYGFGSSEVKQHCQKVRLELPTANRKPSDPVVAGIPTLQDLLNADSEQVAIDEDALFNHADPYGMEDLEAMEEGEDDTDTAAPPLVIQRANFPTLEIEAYVDLKAPKLTQRFAATQGMPEEPTARPAKLPAKPSTGSWTTKDAEWDAGNW